LSSTVLSEDFPDGKYFASVYADTYDFDKPRWTVEIYKIENTVAVISLKITKSNLGTACCTLDISDMELSDKFNPTELVNKSFDFGRVRFVKGVNLKFYGEFGRFSKLSFPLFSAYQVEARFKWVPYKYYDMFQRILEGNPKFTTEEFMKVIDLSK